MRQAISRSPVAACTLAAALVLSACGGGGASAPGTVTGSSGFVVDDYLSGATVLCDSNNNGVADAGEATILTDSSGFFRFTPACGAAMVVTGGTNIDTGLPFIGMMRAPAGSTVVTPMSTLVSAGMSLAEVNAALGLPATTDVLNTDPARKVAGALVNGGLMKKSLALQQVLQKTTEILAGLATSGGDAAKPAIYGEVAAAMAAALPLGNALGAGNNLDASVLVNLIKAATLRVASSTALPAAVKAGAQGVNSESLAQVVAGAIKAQADSILVASNAGITAATQAAQSDMQITVFVATNKTQMASAPNGALQTLGTSLTDQVMASLNGGTPPVNTGANVLVSFDAANPAFSNMGAFGGALPTVEAGPSGGSGNALRILKPAAPDTWGGVFFDVAALPFAANRTMLTARVNTTRAGAVILLKVESGNGGPAVEIAGTTVATANAWQTVSWDLTGVDITKSYTVIAITPDQAVVTTGQSYFIDDISLAPASTPTPPPASGTTLLSFDEANPAFMNMGSYGGALPTVEAGPSGGTGNALRILKPVAPDTWGGVFFNVDPIPFAANRTTLTARVNATRAGAVILLKVESANGGPTVEIAGTTVATANTWQTVSWNLLGVDISKSYTVIAITPDQSVVTTGQSYFIDDISLAPASAAPAPLPAPSGTTLVSFDEANPAFANMGAYGGALPTVETGPSGGTANALRILKPVAPDAWGGVFFNVAAIPFTTDRKTLSARVSSTRAGAVILLKVESANGGPTVEVAGTIVAAANTWQTVVWNLTGVDFTKSYTVIAITPDQALTTTGQSYYIDDLTLENAGAGGGGAAASVLTFSPGFSAGELTGSGGSFGGFSGSNLDGFNCNGQPASCGGGGVFSGDAASRFFYYYQTTTPAVGLYMGIYVLGPNVTTLNATNDADGVQITNQTALKFNLEMNSEWFSTATKNFAVEMDLGKLYLINGNACRLQIRKVVTPTAATASNYSIALSSFSISQNCGTSLTVAQALALSPISQVTFKANGGSIALSDGTLTTGANLSVPTGGVYPTTIGINGAITFE